METLQLKAYLGKDLAPDTFGEAVIFIGVFWHGELQDCVCAADTESSRKWMGSYEMFSIANQMGMIDTGYANPIAHEFIKQPDLQLLWEEDVEGKKVYHTTH